MILDLWQGKELEARFADLWHLKDLAGLAEYVMGHYTS
jgi:hypothetical protein